METRLITALWRPIEEIAQRMRLRHRWHAPEEGTTLRIMVDIRAPV
jgi:hypothetical protein